MPRKSTPGNRLRPLASAERLKSFANNDGANESWDDNFEGDLTVRCPANPPRSPLKKAFEEDDPNMQTIRPYVQRRPSDLEPPDTPELLRPSTAAPPEGSPSKHQVMKPRKKFNVLPLAPNATGGRRLTSNFREDGSEDYSDLAPFNESSFVKKVDLMKKDASLSPRLFHPSDLKNSLPRSSKSSQNGGSTRRMPTPFGDTEKETHRMRRSPSALEIGKFIEAEGEEDYSDVFGGSEAGTDEAGSETSGDEQQSLMLNSKLSNNSWLGDEGDEDDPFAELEEGFDEMDLEANIARDKYARLCLQIDGLVSSLKTTQSEDDLDEISSQLMEILLESPETKANVISAHGMLPILEVLETCEKREVVAKLLKIVNAVSRRRIGRTDGSGFAWDSR